jgi:hypothetical protein
LALASKSEFMCRKTAVRKQKWMLAVENLVNESGSTVAHLGFWHWGAHAPSRVAVDALVNRTGAPPRLVNAREALRSEAHSLTFVLPALVPPATIRAR